MADPIEELLKQIQQNETAQSSPAASSLPSNPSVDRQVPSDPSKPIPIDHLLEEIEGKPAVKPVPRFEESPQTESNPSSEAARLPRSLRAVPPGGSPNPQSVDALLSQLDGTVKNPPPVQPPILPQPSQIRTQIHKETVAPAQSQPKPNPPQPEAHTAKPVTPAHPQLEKQKRRQAIERRAQEWLKNLDPHGGEAHFFETLAEKYSSRLEAAIDFLGLEPE